MIFELSRLHFWKLQNYKKMLHQEIIHFRIDFTITVQKVQKLMKKGIDSQRMYEEFPSPSTMNLILRMSVDCNLQQASTLGMIDRRKTSSVTFKNQLFCCHLQQIQLGMIWEVNQFHRLVSRGNCLNSHRVWIRKM